MDALEWRWLNLVETRMKFVKIVIFKIKISKFQLLM